MGLICIYSTELTQHLHSGLPIQPKHNLVIRGLDFGLTHLTFDLRLG